MDSLETNHQLSDDQSRRIKDLILSSNEKLEEIGTSSSSQAFNLGCWIGTIPIALLVMIVFLATGGEWIVAILTALLLILALAGFSNYAAYRARIQSIDRVYQNEVLPQINQLIEDLNLNREEFDNYAARTLTPGAALYKYLSVQNEIEETSINNTGNMEGKF